MEIPYKETTVSYDFNRIVDRRQTNSIKWTLYPEDVLPLWVADMDFPAPPPVLEALRAAVEHGIFGYEMPSKHLRESVAARMKKLYDWEVAPEMVVATTGLVSAFFAAGQALCRPGEGYLIQPPVYMPFLDIQKRQGAICQHAPLVPVAQGSRVRYQIDWQAFENGIHSGGSRTRMFLLCNPHNPSGAVYSREELSRMAELCLEKDLTIVSDEIHSELLLGGARHTPIATLSPEIAARTITLVAPSKTFNTAGLFCGFAIIPDPALRKRFEAEVERMTLHVASLAQVAAEAAFSGACDGWLAELLAYLTANRDFVVEFVERELPGVRVSVPDATYLAWLDCEALGLEGSPYKFFLHKAKVALNEGSAFGPGGESFVRLNFGCPRATLEEALGRMKEAIHHR
jgi:cystathionine beta-lyase